VAKGKWAISVDDVSFLVEEGLEVHQAALDYNAGGNEDGDFFVKKRDNSTALTQLDEYLLSPSIETMTVIAWPLNKRLFFETSTPPPASAACERLFSATRHIFSPMRACIGDTNFENQRLLNLNKGFVR
jgi:hypothetical protein